MSKDKTATSGMILQGIFQLGIYKSSQGRIARQLSALALVVIFLLCARGVYLVLPTTYPVALKYGIPFALCAVGIWISYRAVNVPRFADFLIAVEAEMKKVSWPTKNELIRSSLVVIFVIFFLALVLWGFDLFWQLLFEKVLKVF